MSQGASRDALWSAAHAERAALADDLAGLYDAQWAQPSLCGRWVVEEVVAHLTAAASIGPLRWFASVLGARFDFELHNERRLAEHRGATPAETLERFRRVVASTTAPLGPTAAFLGEVIVHAQDIRRPLGLPRTRRWTSSPPSHAFVPGGTLRCPVTAPSRVCAWRRPTGPSRPAPARSSPVPPWR